MARAEFAFLHVHSWYSTRTGVPSISELAERAAHLGYRALALTDYCSLAGVPEFVQQCRTRNVKPLVGAEVPLTLPLAGGFVTDRFVFLAEDDTGYLNLSRFLTEVFSKTTVSVPAGLAHGLSIPLQMLHSFASGLIVITGGTAAKLTEFIVSASWEFTHQYLNSLFELFDREQICLAVDHPNIALPLKHFARRHGLTAVAAPAIYYLSPADSLAYVFLSGQPCPAIFLPNARASDSPLHHLARHEEVQSFFHSDYELLGATLRIVERCHALQSAFRPRFPTLDVPRTAPDAYLYDVVSREAERLFKEIKPEIRTRLDAELAAVQREGLADRFILLHSLIRYCRDHGVTIGVGGGDLVTSLVAYVLGLTQVNAHDFKLNFCGFGNVRAAGTTETFALEIPVEAAPVVEKFLEEFIGEGHCARVGRYSVTSRSALIRALSEWMGLDQRSAASTELVERDGLRHFHSFVKHSTDSVALPSPQVLAFLLSRLLGRPEELSFSETDMAISSERLEYLVPLARIGGSLCTQVGAAGLDVMRIPRLILSTSPQLRILNSAAAWIREEQNLDVAKAPLDDPRTYELLRRGLTLGIEPFQSMRMRMLLRHQAPRNFRELLKVRSEDALATGDARDIRHFLPECLLGYRLAYVKAHFPACFFAAAFSRMAESKQTKRLAAFFREAREMGVKILGPDINRSSYQFTIERGAVRCGLSMIKAVGEKTYHEIDQARSRGEFEDLLDLRRRTERRIVNSAVLANLIRAGALDCFEEDRNALLARLETLDDEAAEHAGTLFDEVAEALGAGTAPSSAREILQQEIEATDVPISVDPISLFSLTMRRASAARFGSLSRRDVGRDVSVVGFLNHIDEQPTKEGGVDVYCADFDGYPLHIPAKVRQAYERNLSAEEPLYVCGVAHQTTDGAIAVRAHAIFTLSEVEELSGAVRSISLDLGGENLHTLRLLGHLIRRYKKGTTRLDVLSIPTGFATRLLAWRIHRSRVFFCPGLYYQLRKILTENQIELVFTDETTEHYAMSLLAPFQYAKSSSSETLPAIELY
ncbi:MAG: PHP domain-containing protein [Candidatus Sumerlaeaceae bacterium]